MLSGPRDALPSHTRFWLLQAEMTQPNAACVNSAREQATRDKADLPAARTGLPKAVRKTKGYL